MTLRSDSDRRPASDKDYERLLTTLTRELQKEPPPSIDEEHLTRSLFKHLDSHPAQAQPSPRALPLWQALITYAAVATATASLFVSLHTSQAHRPFPTNQTTQSAQNPSYVSGIPYSIKADTQEVRSDRPGFASWVLEPHSRVSVLQDDSHQIVLSLEAGAVWADVVPQPVAERFVILVERTRVAVHGTKFRVARVDDHVEVDVARGVVAVGQNTLGPSARWLLEAHQGGSFRLDDPRQGRLRPALSFDVSGGPSTTKARESSAEAKSPAAPPVFAETPKLVDEASLRLKLSSTAATCFEQEAHLPPDVHLTVATTMSITYGPDGRSRDIAFTPPVAPAVASCVQREATRERGPTGHYQIEMSLAERR